ncbi:hypothetical protein VNO77_17818 [Canavalia gladiata]|uniref:Small nuclear ribonucleoprotein G n=2 Tax=Phaseoleae TaxID=163735 RepID=A0AAN9LPM6_CANGL
MTTTMCTEILGRGDELTDKLKAFDTDKCVEFQPQVQRQCETILVTAKRSIRPLMLHAFDFVFPQPILSSSFVPVIVVWCSSSPSGARVSKGRLRKSKFAGPGSIFWALIQSSLNKRESHDRNEKKGTVASRGELGFWGEVVVLVLPPTQSSSSLVVRCSNLIIMSRSGQPPDLKKYMDKKLQIKLNANRMIVGTLRGFDQFMNLVVDNTVEVNGNEKNDIGMVVIRGNSVVTVEALEPVNRA